MGKSKLGLSGRIDLPIGFRFRPTDEELVVHYLARKVSGFPLPASVIPEFDIFQTHPWGFPGDVNEKRYFFSKKRANENELKRADSSSWKSIGKGKLILGFENKKVVGTRKTLIFCETKKRPRPQTMKTRWFLHEYGFIGSPSIPCSTQTSMEDWVVHCLFKKRRRPRKSEWTRHQLSNAQSPSFMDIAEEEEDDGYGNDDPPQPCSSCSSAITEVCFNGENGEENSPFY